MSLLARTDKLDPNEERVLEDLMRALLDLRHQIRAPEYRIPAVSDGRSPGARRSEAYTVSAKLWYNIPRSLQRLNRLWASIPAAQLRVGFDEAILQDC